MKKLFLLIVLFIIVGCQKSERKADVVIAVGSDAETLNPLYSVSQTDIYINQLTYLNLITNNWDSEEGRSVIQPLFAKSIEFAKDSTLITINLKGNVKWSDGKPCTAYDVVFSYDIFSDNLVNSRMVGMFEIFSKTNGKIDIPKHFEIINDSIFAIKFDKKKINDLSLLDIPILPKHKLENLDRKKLFEMNIKDILVQNGAYKISNWKKNEAVILAKNEKSFLINEKSPDKIIFKVISDYNSRIIQLKNKEVDLIEDIQPSEMKLFKEEKYIKLAEIKGREYESLGLNNISPTSFKNNKIIANELFGSQNVRKAIMHAINREEIYINFLNKYGEIANGPISKSDNFYYSDSIYNYSYNPKMSISMLKEEGWVDSNNNGTIDKNGKEFSFELVISASNPRRSFAAKIYKNNLKAIGIDIKIKEVEMNSFINHILKRELNAWIISWVLPSTLDLKQNYYSDLKNNVTNFSGYRNSEIDALLNKIASENNIKTKVNLYKKVQRIINDELPVLFLYWIPNIIGYNNRIKNIKFSPLGVIHNCWKWEVD